EGKNATFLNVPIALWGIGFYIMSILYFLMPSLNDDNKNLLAQPFFIVVLIANFIDLWLLTHSLVNIGAFCLHCSMLYVANLGILALVYVYDIKPRPGSLKEYFKSLSSNLYQKELLIFGVLTILVMALLFFFGGNQKLQIAYKKVFEDKATQEKKIEKQLEEIVQAYQKSPVQSFDRTGLPTKGSSDPVFDFVVFHDMQCGHCHEGFYELRKLMKKYQPLVRVTYIDFPIIGSIKRKSQLNSFQLAGYGLLAHKTGKYMEFCDKLFQLYKAKVYVDKAQVHKILRSLGVEGDKNTLDLEAMSFKHKLTLHRQFGEKLGVNSTPTAYINGKKSPGSLHPLVIERIIRTELIRLAKAKK
ncbi:MAG: thioredoxin domain-containing protein, partial [Spirochaetota bacterium]|nr:thioredoxin domain-containing protein [Spirochaetota bacterium]